MYKYVKVMWSFEPMLTSVFKFVVIVIGFKNITLPILASSHHGGHGGGTAARGRSPPQTAPQSSWY